MSSYGVNPTTGALEEQYDGMRSLEDIQSILLDMCYPVGSVYVSTENTSPQTFLGGTWISLDGYVLRAADGTNDVVTPNQNQNDGGADSVTVSSVANHNHTQNAHKHSILATGLYGGLMSMYQGGGGSVYNCYVQGSSALNTGDQTATNIANGANYTVNTLPKYKNVYMWERVS